MPQLLRLPAFPPSLHHSQLLRPRLPYLIIYHSTNPQDARNLFTHCHSLVTLRAGRAYVMCRRIASTYRSAGSMTMRRNGVRLREARRLPASFAAGSSDGRLRSICHVADASARSDSCAKTRHTQSITTDFIGELRRSALGGGGALASLRSLAPFKCDGKNE